MSIIYKTGPFDNMRKGQSSAGEITIGGSSAGLSNWNTISTLNKSGRAVGTKSHEIISPAEEKNFYKKVLKTALL